MPTSKSTAASALCFVALVSGADAHEDAAELGEVNFPVSCDEASQHAFTEGVTLLHHMMYHQASARFSAAAEADADCAMAYWGVAMTSFHPMWPGGQSEAEFAAGREAAAQAAAAVAERVPTALEVAYVGAVTAFYESPEDTYPQRLGAWAEAQQRIAEEFPDNIDAGAFAALAKLSVVPPNDRSFAVQREAGARLEQLHEAAPMHPGVFHYAIHAYDHPPLAALAEGYDQIAPNVPHALHMPSHIFTRLGRWPEAVDWNTRSASAALEQPLPDGTISNHYPHAIDYLVYALLQMGEAAEAAHHVTRLVGTEALEDNFGSAYALSAAPARLALETGDWAAAAALADVPHASISWDRFPQALAIVAFAQGIGAARAADPEAATTALDRLRGYRDAMVERDMQYWVTLADAQIGSIEAWVALASGDDAVARRAMEAAADIEDMVGKAPVTPGHVLPARELVGAMLMELGDTDAAAEAYEAALAQSPNRARSLEGLAAAGGG